MELLSRSGDQKLLQEMNRALVMNTIYHYESISRIEISKLTKLSQSTVSNVVDGLQKEGIVIEAGSGSSTKAGGRRPTMLTIRSSASYILSVAIITEAFHITLQLCLFDLRLRVMQEVDYVLYEKGTQLILSIKAIVRDFIAAHADKTLTGIGFSIPTVLNREGVIYRGHLLDLDNFPLEQELSKSFPGITFWVEQEQHAAVLGERFMGKAKDVENVIYVTVGRGIGASMIVNNKLLRGEYGAAGEIGHMSINKFGGRCICGNTGCLRLTATELAFIQKIKEAVDAGLPLPDSIYDPDSDEIHVLEVYREAVNGDGFCKSLVMSMLEDLSTGISNLVYLFNPRKIILGGNLLLAEQLATPYILDKLKGNLDAPSSSLVVEAAQLGIKSSLYGVASIILEKFFLNKDLLISR